LVFQFIFFWYFNLSEQFHTEFLEELAEIKDMWINEDQQERNLNIKQAISQLEQKNKPINQDNKKHCNKNFSFYMKI